MMILRIVLFFNIFITINTVINAQCDNFSYHMQELVINVNDISSNTLDSYYLIRKASFSDDFDEIQELSNSALDFSKNAKNSSDYAENSSSMAVSTASDCYCVNGQSFAYKAEDAVLEISDLLSVANKNIKRANKAKSIDEAKKCAYIAMEALESVEKLCIIAVENATEGQFVCD